MTKKILDNVSPLSNRGVTRTNNYFIEENYTGKEVKIDWFQITFDFIPVKFFKDSNRYVLEKDDYRFIELIKILNPPSRNIKGDYNLYIHNFINNIEPRKSGRYRFDNGYHLGDNIELMYGGNKTALETYPTTLIFTGQGCREFELAGGDWIELFEFIFKYGSNGYLKIGRLDIAIDDFDGNEITPYEIESYIRKHHYTSIFRNVNYNISEIHSANPETSGFTITFGSKGSNQLQIYDKKLERRNNKQYDKDTNVWYRYEMRFVDEKAKQVLDLYIESVKGNDITFIDYMSGVLKGLLDIKEYNPNDMRISRWNTLPAWDNFLNSFNKIDLRKRSPVETNLDKKINWFENNMTTTLLELALILDGNVNKVNEYINELMSSSDFKEKHLKRLNAHRDKENKTNYSMNDIEQIKEKFGNITEKDKIIKTLMMIESRIDDWFIYDDELDCIYFENTSNVFEYKIIDSESAIIGNTIYINREYISKTVVLKKMIENYYYTEFKKRFK